METSDKLKIELDKIKSDGCNIYQLMYRLKKMMKKPKDWAFPEPVLFQVCESYWKYKPVKPWPWFLKVIKQQSRIYFADQHIRQNELYKKYKPALSLGQIMNMAQEQAKEADNEHRED